MISSNRAANRIIRFVASLFILFGLIIYSKGKQPYHFLARCLLLSGSIIIIGLMIRNIVWMIKNRKINS